MTTAASRTRAIRIITTEFEYRSHSQNRKYIGICEYGAHAHDVELVLVTLPFKHKVSWCSTIIFVTQYRFPKSCAQRAQTDRQTDR